MLLYQINTTEMKRIIYIISFYLTLVLCSCSFHNRMTSPEVLTKDKRIQTFGIVANSNNVNKDGFVGPDKLTGYSPIIGYRSGIGHNQEMGIALNGIYTPGLVVDHKIKYFERENFILSGNMAFYGGFVRPIGIQHDFLFGKRQFYGSIGVSYDFNTVFRSPMMVLGLGGERIRNSPWGYQISYMGNIDNLNLFSIGLKVDFIKTKKKYQTFEKADVNN